jgi:ribosomal protein S18 acetylase RimI-like enzyme
VPDDYLNSLTAASQRERLARRLVPDSQIKTLVAAEGNAIVAYACAGPQRDGPESIAELYSIYVHPSQWRGGLGRLLLSRMMELVKSQGFARLSLSVFESNERAVKFYQSAGFVADGSREMFSQENWTLPLIRMVCSLAD